jgi:plastocyanin
MEMDMPTLKRSRFFQAPLIAALALAAACGGGENQPAPAATEAPAAAPAAAPGGTGPAAAGNVIEVQMITTDGGASGRFEPAQITARQGDVIRIINDGGGVHNLAFAANKNPSGAALPPSSPFLAGAGQTADVPVTMGAGSYNFECTPHAMMGMVGTLTVN